MKKLIPALAVFLVLLAVPLAGVDAQEPIRVEVGGEGYMGMVPCSGDGCSTCDLVTLGNTLITWLITALFVVFAVIMVVAGFGLVTSGGSQSALEAAKSKFQNALIGIILVLAAWLIVDTLLKGILAGGTGNVMSYGPWNEVQCTTQEAAMPWDGNPQSPDAPANIPPLTPAPGTTPGSPAPVPTSCTGGTGGTCAALGIPCSNANSCSISPDLVDNFQAFHQAAGVNGARVTEAMPPTRTHKSACHNNGTCVDYSKPGGMTSAEVVSTINAANANGLRAVYEVHTTAQRDTLVAAGAPAANIVVLGTWITAPHFSIYGY